MSVFSSFVFAAPPSVLLPAFSAPSARPSVPGFPANLGVAALAVPDAAPTVALSLFLPFVVSRSAEAPVTSSSPAGFASAPSVASWVCVWCSSGSFSLFCSFCFVYSSSAFAASPDDQYDPGFPDSVPRDPEVPIPSPVPDSVRAEIRRMYAYIVDLFPQAVGSPSIDSPPRALFEDFFTPALTPQQPI